MSDPGRSGRYAPVKAAWISVVTALFASVCAIAVTVTLGASASAAKAPTKMKALVFLTRDGCVNTPDMVNNLEDALKALGWSNDYQYINIGKLKKTDPRTGYPTPTLLWKGRDIFGMPVPKPPYDVPS